MNDKVRGKTIAITTTNGTQAIEAAKHSSKVIIGSFLNMDLITEYLKKQQKDVLFLCAGWKNKFNLEDTLFAGAVADSLIYKYGFNSTCDSTIAAMELYKLASSTCTDSWPILHTATGWPNWTWKGISAIALRPISAP